MFGADRCRALLLDLLNLLILLNCLLHLHPLWLSLVEPIGALWLQHTTPTNPPIHLLTLSSRPTILEVG